MKTLIISFVLIVVAQLTVPLKMIHDKQAPLIYGEEFMFKTQPIDPYDPFRGKYVILNFADNYIDVDRTEKWNYGETVYVEFFKGDDGFAKIKSISKEIPENSNSYLRTSVQHTNSRGHSRKKQRVSVHYSFKRYYMEESKAEKAERLARNFSRDNTYDVSLVVKLYKGGASIKKLQVGDISMEEAAGHESFMHH